jgi:hypothetical protein
MCVDDDDDEAQVTGIRGVAGELAIFSSRWPTREMRLKPDVVAPGVGILWPGPGSRRSTTRA